MPLFFPILLNLEVYQKVYLNKNILYNELPNPKPSEVEAELTENLNDNLPLRDVEDFSSDAARNYSSSTSTLIGSVTNSEQIIKLKQRAVSYPSIYTLCLYRHNLNPRRIDYIYIPPNRSIYHTLRQSSGYLILFNPNWFQPARQ